jgi:hypothetical protein
MMREILDVLPIKLALTLIPYQPESMIVSKWVDHVTKQLPGQLLRNVIARPATPRY